MFHALGTHRLHAGHIGQHEVASRQAVTIPVPQQVAVRRQADERHRRRPEAGGNAGVRQVKRDEIRPPAGGQPGKDGFPGLAGRNRHIGVIGTRATIRSGAYEKALRAADETVRVSSRACPLLVPLIEEGLLNDAVTDQMILRYLEPLLKDEIDTLVLGCTHYPLLTDAIARVLRRQIMVVDSAQNCARAVEEMLDRQSLRAAPLNNGKLPVALTGKENAQPGDRHQCRA